MPKTTMSPSPYAPDYIRPSPGFLMEPPTYSIPGPAIESSMSRFYEGCPKRMTAEPQSSAYCDVSGVSTPKRRRLATQPAGARPSGACTRCKRLKVQNSIALARKPYFITDSR